MDQKSEVAATVKQSTSTVSGSVENERICQLSNGPINGRLRCSNQTAGAVQSAASVRLITVNRDRRTIGQWKTAAIGIVATGRQSVVQRRINICTIYASCTTTISQLTTP
ncbi:hypothetical protein T06_12346 [Trichinella sp. T6]|nr:hypothetical protein T06_12346 [Trichinella sp. T6]